MEVSGIEGHFRSTCESVMQVLREHKVSLSLSLSLALALTLALNEIHFSILQESLMAVLEAFAYDPLIGWKMLMRPTTLPAPAAVHVNSASHSLGEAMKQKRRHSSEGSEDPFESDEGVSSLLKAYSTFSGDGTTDNNPPFFGKKTFT